MSRSDGLVRAAPMRRILNRYIEKHGLTSLVTDLAAVTGREEKHCYRSIYRIRNRVPNRGGGYEYQEHVSFALADHLLTAIGRPDLLHTEPELAPMVLYSRPAYTARARRERWLVGRCAECGVEYHDRRIGCKTCTQRHSKRKMRDQGEQHARRCAGCGCSWDERTFGCKACGCRHRNRLARGIPSVAASLVCRGCGCDYDNRTPGCATCASRWRGRNNKPAELREAA